MKIDKLHSYSSNHQIWRLLFSESDNLIIETRDVAAKEVYFNCLEPYTGKIIFDNLQFEEKYWIGIETVYRDIIYFHKYAKPDMPGHREIIAYNINTKQILWRTDSYAFLFIYKEVLYCFKQKFEGRNYYSLNYRTGELIDDLGNDAGEINRLRDYADEGLDFSSYYFPEKYNEDMIDNKRLKDLISGEIKNVEIVRDVEYTIYKTILLFNYHSRVIGNSLINKFIALNIASGKILFSEILNANVNAFVPDSFLVYKDLLFLLKEKKEVIVCKLIL